VDKLFSLQKQSLRSEEQRLLGKNGEENTVKAADALVCYVPIPDIKEYNMYGDEDLFYTKQFLDIIFKSLYNRKTNLYLISENTIGLEPMVKDGLYTESLGKELGLHRSLSIC
jgi:hypothetical protein